MKHEIKLALDHIRKLIAKDQPYSITAVALKFKVHRVSLSRALKREGITT